MSKERASLKLHGSAAVETFNAEVDKILAQPEQTEQEPVAWMWTRNYEGGGYVNMMFHSKCHADEYAKDSEDLKYPDLVRPLYLGVEK